MKLLSTLMVLMGCIFSFQYQVYAGDDYKPKEGDIILLDDPPPVPGIREFIQGITMSWVTHCVIVKKAGSEFDVIEAIEPTRITPLEELLERANGKYTVLRVNKGTKQKGLKIQKFIESAESYLGSHYDFSFKFNNDEIYCSELIYLAWKDATGQEIIEPKKIEELNYQPFIPVLDILGLTLDQEVIIPDLSSSKYFTIVYQK